MKNCSNLNKDVNKLDMLVAGSGAKKHQRLKCNLLGISVIRCIHDENGNHP